MRMMMSPANDSNDSEDDYGCDETSTRIDSNSGLEYSRSSSSDSPGIGRAETKSVNRSKRFVYVILLLVATSFAVLTYVFLQEKEEDEFKLEFGRFALELLSLSQGNAIKKFGAVKSLATALTSYAIGTGMTWPNVTLGHFSTRVGDALELSNAEQILFLPLVSKAEGESWADYATSNQGWIKDGNENRNREVSGRMPEHIHDDLDEEFDAMSDPNDSLYFTPVWQTEPAPFNATLVGLDLSVLPWFKQITQDIQEIKHELLSGVVDASFLFKHSYLQEVGSDVEPQSVIVQPVFFFFFDDAHVVGLVAAIIRWKSYFADVLPTGIDGIVVDVEDTCGSEFTYSIDGHTANLVGEGDLHDRQYDNLVRQSAFAEFARYDGSDNTSGVHCEYTVKVYPSDTFRELYESSDPIIYTVAVALVFLFTTCVFFVYDIMVQRRQHIVMSAAKRTSAIVKSLFPKEIHDKLMERAASNKSSRTVISSGFFFATAQIKNFLGENNNEDRVVAGANKEKTKPIAELFPNCTILFADIVGFTAWSSMRDPSSVFTLLETIFCAFDEIAKNRRVFKVETVGDCYVAATGLPDARKDHALAMARFARDCLFKVATLTAELEISLGPGTAELGMRFGLHSGQVTAGVLRGDKARFQLFGDTVNTAARIETSGLKNKIHLSQETANLLIAAGKSHWVRARDDKVFAKGKGEMSTFWLHVSSEEGQSLHSGSGSEATNELCRSYELVQAKKSAQSMENTQLGRLVDWNTDILLNFLRDIEARRVAAGEVSDPEKDISDAESKTILKTESIVLDEVKEIITTPQFCERAAKMQKGQVAVRESVREQLREFVCTIAACYKDNPFHNFEHASHVTMSVVKLLSRIVAPDIDKISVGTLQKDLYDHTFGITSDPLTQFTMVLSALLHDADHPGVPNSQLQKEDASFAAAYRNKSIAEQNSVDLTWRLLMEDRFKELRRTIYSTVADFQRFRQLLVNSIMATDIMDKELNALRKGRWNKAFSLEGVVSQEDPVVHKNRKATIVTEHLIQASDVVHTMQHWHIYRKWNKRLFEEMYRAYTEGRATSNPADNWYEGELGFFDHYVIPLATKLKTCGVFGVSSDEYLSYAEQNRHQWAIQGKDVVAELVESLSKKVDSV